MKNVRVGFHIDLTAIQVLLLLNIRDRYQLFICVIKCFYLYRIPCRPVIEDFRIKNS